MPPSPAPPPTSGGAPLAFQLPYFLFIVVLFLGFGQAVRRGRVTGRAILVTGALVGLAAAAASLVAAYFSLPAGERAQAPLGLLLVSPLTMLVTATACTLIVYRSQRVRTMANYHLGDTVVDVCYSPAALIHADALLLPVSTALRLVGGGGGMLSAVGAAGGPAIERELRAAGRVGAGKVVRTGGGRLNVDYLFFAVAYEPLRPTEEGHLRRALENAAQQARKIGLDHIAVAVGALRGMTPRQSAVASVEAVLRQRRAFAQITFVALDVRSAQTLAEAAQSVVTSLGGGSDVAPSGSRSSSA
jgi:O-acetyl-ADP-ribose deacetylase (regulator of RNase III)